MQRTGTAAPPSALAWLAPTPLVVGSALTRGSASGAATRFQSQHVRCVATISFSRVRRLEFGKELVGDQKKKTHHKELVGDDMGKGGGSESEEEKACSRVRRLKHGGKRKPPVRNDIGEHARIAGVTNVIQWRMCETCET